MRPVELFPGFQVPFTFNWHVDTLTLPGAVTHEALDSG